MQPRCSGASLTKPEPVGNLERRGDDKEGANQREFLCTGVTSNKGRINEMHLLMFNGFVGQDVTTGPLMRPETSRVMTKRSLKRRLQHAHVVRKIVAGELFNLHKCETQSAAMWAQRAITP